jgi:release factor glutamine methyltransferase
VSEPAGGALARAIQALRLASLSPRLDAEVLLAHVLGIGRARLLAHPELALTPQQAETFRRLTERHAGGEPVAYLSGYREFYGLRFQVGPEALIPRPETEHLVDAALAWGRGRPALRIVDVGTGAGSIAVALAIHLADATVIATDISSQALALARANAEAHGVVNRIALVRGDLLAPLTSPIDLIAANLPYIPTAQLNCVSPYEPRAALDGGPDGLRLIARLFEQAPLLLKDESLLLVEIGFEQAEAVSEMARRALPDARVSVAHDYAGHPRVVRVESWGKP